MSTLFWTLCHSKGHLNKLEWLREEGDVPVRKGQTDEEEVKILKDQRLGGGMVVGRSRENLTLERGRHVVLSVLVAQKEPVICDL